MKKVIFSLSLFFLLSTIKSLDVEKGQYYWNDIAQKAINESLKLKDNNNVAKNVIVFMGDGMDVTTVTAARIYKIQKTQRLNPDGGLTWDKFPHVAMLKTYNLDKMVPDSASTATAYLCGVKTNFRTVGVDGRAKYGNCSSALGAQVDSIAAWSVTQGKSAGVISTTLVTDASIAAAYAHSPSRDWHADTAMPKESEGCKDIASQLIEDFPGKDFKVILGGGRTNFKPYSTRDHKTQQRNTRRDGKDLVGKWVTDKKLRKAQYSYVENVDQLRQVNTAKTDYLLGLFAQREMEFEIDRKNKKSDEPSLKEMTASAIKILSKNKNGYFLFVEGARIDHGHHDNKAAKVLEEAVQMDEAVETAMKLVDLDETLIVVTADHAHSLTISGYADREESILGVAGHYPGDKLRHTVLLYSNGPGNKNAQDKERSTLNDYKTGKRDFRTPAGFKSNSAAHAGDDIQAFAIGPMSHLFHGVQEQNYVAHALGYASCVGQNKNHCEK